MTAYLGLYADVRKYLLAPDDHRHEVGEDTTRCRNCLLAREATKMSAFEAACWVWYQRNLTPFAFEAGLVSRLVERLGLDTARERFFLRAMNEIRQFVLKIQAADMGK